MNSKKKFSINIFFHIYATKHTTRTIGKTRAVTSRQCLAAFKRILRSKDLPSL